jgi:ATP-dependent Zn protease
MSDRRSIAIHEAGHAVVGRAMAQACGGLTVEQDRVEQTEGFSVTHDHYTAMQRWEDAGIGRGEDPERSALIGRIITYMAGRHAEEVILGHCEGGDGDDQQQAGEMIYAIGWPARPDEDDDTARDRFAERLGSFSRAAVIRHRIAIERLARMLLARGTLTETEVADVIAGRIGA